MEQNSTIIHPVQEDRIVKGRLLESPQRISTKNGQMVAFKVAENHYAFDRESKQYEQVGYTPFDVKINDVRLGENVALSLEKGDAVIMVGSSQVQPWQSGEKSGVNYVFRPNTVAPDLRYTSVDLNKPIETEPAKTIEQNVTHDKNTAVDRSSDGVGPWKRAQEKLAQQQGQTVKKTGYKPPRVQSSDPSMNR